MYVYVYIPRTRIHTHTHTHAPSLSLSLSLSLSHIDDLLFRAAETMQVREGGKRGGGHANNDSADRRRSEAGD